MDLLLVGVMVPSASSDSEQEIHPPQSASLGTVGQWKVSAELVMS